MLYPDYLVFNILKTKIVRYLVDNVGQGALMRSMFLFNLLFNFVMFYFVSYFNLFYLLRNKLLIDFSLFSKVIESIVI